MTKKFEPQEIESYMEETPYGTVIIKKYDAPKTEEENYVSPIGELSGNGNYSTLKFGYYNQFYEE